MHFCLKSSSFRTFLCDRSNANRILRGFSSKDEINGKIQSQIKIPDDYDVKNVKKEDMVWRKPPDEYKSYFKTLRVFYSDSNNVEVVKALQTPIDLSYQSIRNWFLKKNKEKEIYLQSYKPERNEILGNELAAAHFIVYRGGAIKFHGADIWVKADEYKNYNLPEHYVKDKYIEAIDCTGTNLYYEGLQNIRNLKYLKWLSLNDCENIDDWCIDTICGAHYKNLVYLDLRNCPLITEKGLTALWKMEQLKILYLDDVLRSSEYEMTVLLLQEHLPELELKVGDFAEDE